MKKKPDSDHLPSTYTWGIKEKEEEVKKDNRKRVCREKENIKKAIQWREVNGKSKMSREKWFDSECKEVKKELKKILKKGKREEIGQMK